MAWPKAEPAGVVRRVLIGAGPARELWGGLFVHGAADVEEVIGDYAKPDPALHTGIAFIAAAIEAVPALDHADAALASGPPFLAVAEPALFLLALALGAFGGAIGDGDALDAHRLGCGFVLGGVKCGIGCQQMRRAAEHCLMRFDGRDQQIRITGAPVVHFVIDHDLIFSLLQFHHLAELGWLACLALADDLRRWLEQTDKLAFEARLAAQDTRSRLLHHLPDERNHAVEFFAQPFERQLLHDIPRPLHAGGNLFREPLRLSHHPAGGIEQLPVSPLEPFLLRLAFGARRSRKGSS